MILEGQKRFQGNPKKKDPAKERERFINLSSRISSEVITSGAIETVPDKSALSNYLIQFLAQNENKFYSAFELATQLLPAVQEDTGKSPQYGTFPKHQAGAFYLNRRQCGSFLEMVNKASVVVSRGSP